MLPARPSFVGLAPPPTDFVSHMLGMIFGPMWTDIAKHGLNLGELHATSTGAFGAGFRVFNIMIFSFATFYIVKLIFEGVAGTAYHGEWLGKKFHSFWTPVRVLGMLFLIAPVAGGYSTAQVLVLWTAHAGIGVADHVAGKMMTVIGKQGAIFSNPPAPSSKKLAESLFLDYVCMDSLDDPALSSNPSLIHVHAEGNKRWTEYQFSGVGHGLPAQTCGEVRVSTPPTQIAMGEAAGMSAMLSKIKPAAQEFEKAVSGEVKHPQPMQRSLISDAASEYTADVMKSVDKYASKKNKSVIHAWKSEQKSDGFAVLGDYLEQIASYDGEIAKLARFQPQITPPLNMKTVGLEGYDVITELRAAQAYVNTQNPALANPTALPASIPQSQTKGEGWLSKKIDQLVNYENSLIAAFNSFGTSSDPLGAMQAFGVRVTSIASSAIAAVVLLGGITELVAMPAVLALLGLLFPLLILGLMLGYIIPMLPYLLYMMAVVGWCGAVITATVGASLWAACHAVPDSNEGFVPAAATQGYRLLLAVFAKPTLIVFGFIAALGLFDAGSWFVGKTFLYVAKTVLGGTTTNGALSGVIGSFAGSVAMVFMVVVIYWRLADWCFGLIHKLPDRALEWMGLSDVSMAEEQTHDNMIGTVVSAHRTTQAPHENLARHVNAEERAGREHARQNRLGRSGQADEADGEAGDS